MKYLNFTDKEKRIIIVLILINSFAFFVNYFGLSPKIKNSDNDYYICLFTNSVKTEGYYGAAYGTNLVQYSPYKSESSFYPFVDFYKSWYDGFYFNGLFPSYDSTEFFIYTLLIFGFFIVKKVISNKNEENITPIGTGTVTVKKEVKFNKSKEYKQLKNLHDLEIINDEEFKSKKKLLKKKIKNDLE